ncbi:MAG: DUF6263 family protein [Mariniblastus sp.]|nr:DUF6263 family protein [Mariniblastus sp.]
MNVYFSRPALTGFLVFALLPLSTICAQETALKWNLASNEKFSLEMQQQVEIVSQVDRRTRTSSNDMQMWIDWEVMGVEANGNYTIKQTIQRIKLVTKTPNDSGEQVINVDTDAQESGGGLAGQLTQMITPLVGNTITFQMTNRGMIESVDIPEASMESLRQAPESMRLRELFSKEGLSEMFGQAALQTPDKPVSQGEQWESRREITSEMGTFERVQAFTFQGQSANSELQVIKLKTEMQEKAPSETGAKLEEFKGTGTFEYNPEEGIFTDSQVDNQMVTSKPYSDMMIETSVTSRIRLRIKRQ